MAAELSNEDLEGQIQVEANQYIPYPIDEVSLDFEVLGPVRDNPEMNNVPARRIAHGKRGYACGRAGSGAVSPHR